MSGTAFPITDEQLDVRNLGEWMLHTFLADYVKRGMGVTADGGANEITVDAGAASIAFDDQLFHAPLDSAETVPYATTTGTNYVYVVFDESSGAVSVDVVDTEGAVTGPVLLIAEVDGSTDAVTLQNDEADIVFDEVTINEAITAPSATIDGVQSPYATDPHDDTAHSFDALNQGGPLTETLDANGQDITDIANAVIDRIDVDLAVDSSTAISGGDPISIDVSGQGVFEVSLDQNASVNLTGASSSGIYSVTLLFEDNGFTPTWDASIVWADGEPPTLDNDLIRITFFTRDAGTTWQGEYSGVF